MNINRDYLIINDVKKSNIRLDNGSMFFYITDKNTQNIFVNLVINVSNNDLIQKYANIENAEDYTLTMNIVKPDNTYKIIEGKLHDKEKAIFEFNLKEDCVDKIGTYKCELLTKCNINDHEEITTSNKLTYKVKSSVLNDLDDIVEAPEYPLVIQLFDKLSDIEQYEEDRRANELARQLAEEQRQTRFDALDADMTNSIEAMDNKVVEVENRITAKEQAVDTLIVNTKADIDEYKVAKDQEIDEYKALKDTEINNAITAQDNKIDTAITSQNDRIAVVESNDAVQDNRLNTVEAKNQQQDGRLDVVENRNTQQDGRLDVVENRNTQQDNRLTAVEAKNTEQDNRLNEIEAIDVAQNSRLDAIEVKNQQQDDRLLDIEKVNKRQDMNLKCLFAESKNNMIDITEEGNSIYLQNSTIGYTLIDEIKGNTLVNCNKEPNKELILNGNINTKGDNIVTITEGVDGGLVDVALEGNTLVNVSKTKDSTGITKAYTVENSGNHIALQGNADGSCSPVITGNTLVNLFDKSVNWEGSLYRNLSLTRVTNGTFTFKAEINDKSSNPSDAVLSIKAKNKNDNTARDLYNTFSNSHGNLNLVFTLSEEEYLYFNNYGVTDDNFYKNYPKPLILEGDYTDKPIPDYFEGLQSTFEDNLVTQEMVDNGEEIADNLGKYRVDYKSTREDGTVGSTKTLYLNSPLLEGDTIEEKDGSVYHVHKYTKVVLDGVTNSGMSMHNDKQFNDDHTMLKISYTREDIKDAPSTTEYDNSLCDKLCWKEDTHNKASDTPCYSRSEFGWKLMINIPLTSDSNETINAYLQSNPLTFVLPLATPQYELIEQSNLVIPSYANGHLDFSTAVPIEKVEFLPFSEELTYLYANTQYTVQFISDRAITADITLGGTPLLAQSIASGLNRISITTPATLLDNKLIINGVANISEVVVTDTDREFGYFEGMKSVGECEELEVVSNNKNLFDMNDLLNYLNENSKYGSYEQNGDGYNIVCKRTSTDLYTNFKPNTQYTLKMKCSLLEGFGVTQFMFVYDDGTVQYSGISDTLLDKVIVSFPNKTIKSFKLTKASGFSKSYFEYIQLEEGSTATEYTPHQSNTQQLTHEPLRAVGEVKDRYVLIDGKWYIERNCKQENMSELKFAGDTGDTMKCLIFFKSKPKAISNIFSNSRGYESATKGQMYVQERGDGMAYLWIPTDSMSSEEFTNFLNEKNATIVYVMAESTYEPIDYNPLEVYSGITHITANSTIPTNIVVKNHGFNCLLKPSTTYTISSNLGLNTVTTPSTLTEDCLRFMDTDTSDVTIMRDVLVLEGDWTTKAELIPAHFAGMESAFEQEYDAEKGKYKVNVKVDNEDKSQENNIEFYINEPLRGTSTAKDRVYVKEDKVVVQRNCGVRPYEDGDFGTYLTDKVNTVYPLTEPVYEEVEYNDTKLFIESFKNSTLSYNSNVPVTSKLYYSYSVPIVDTVAQTANVTDQQDSMIIDLATQVAVMEMMLM